MALDNQNNIRISVIVYILKDTDARFSPAAVVPG